MGGVEFEAFARVDGRAGCVRSSWRFRNNVGSTMRLRNDRTLGSISARGVRKRLCYQDFSNGKVVKSLQSIPNTVGMCCNVLHQAVA